jgi:GNAT superfamily N-acetyltransferase
MAELNIRPAIADDLQFLVATVARIAEFGETAWRDRATMISIDTKNIEQELLAPKPGSVILVAQDAAGTLLGFIHLVSEMGYFSIQPHAHIGDLAVVPGKEGQGVGAALLQAAEAWAREHDFSQLDLNVFVQNPRARALYERMGFVADIVRYVKPIAKQERDT